MIGKILDRRYLITDDLVQGGFSQTFIAQDTKSIDYPKCLVKQFSPLTRNEVTLRIGLKKFEEEARALSRLGEHRQIPRLLAYFKEDEELYIVQEYIEGYPLGEEIKQGYPLAEPQVIAILADLLETLTYVHAHDVIHRDIKPTNVIRRDRDRRLVLIDFGAVKNVLPNGSLPTVVIGTPGYMAPEQLAGEPGFQSDLYSLGIMCCEALTGLKFDETGIREGVSKNDQDEVIWPGTVQISPGLRNFLAKMVRQKSEERYASAADALQALQVLSADVVEPTTPPQNSVVMTSTSLSQPTRPAVPATVVSRQLSRNFLSRSNLLPYLPWLVLPIGGLIFAVGVMPGLRTATVCQGTYPCLAVDGKVLQKSFSAKDRGNNCNPKNNDPDLMDPAYCQLYTVSGKKGQTVTIDMQSKQINNPALALLKPNLELLAENGGISPDNPIATITTVLPEDGDYVLIAKSPEGQAGDYSLLVRN